MSESSNSLTESTMLDRKQNHRDLNNRYWYKRRLEQYQQLLEGCRDDHGLLVDIEVIKLLFKQKNQRLDDPMRILSKLPEWRVLTGEISENAQEDRDR